MSNIASKIQIKIIRKDCPFCHDIPMVIQDPILDDCNKIKNHEYYVACKNGSCRVQPKTIPYNDSNMTAQECIDKSIEDWNTR